MTSLAQPNINDVTESAVTETVLNPRFYRTDVAALEAIDLTPVRREWDEMMREFDNDGNVDHFVRDESFASEIRELDPELKAEFLDFMVSSVTSEYSGCVLYDDIEKSVSNPDIRKVMAYMRRDEARHAGFINRSLKDFGKQVDLGFLKREKKKTYFRPKFIFYATCPKRSAMRVTLRSSGICRSIRSIVFIRSFAGSNSGVTTSSAMARLSR